MTSSFTPEVGDGPYSPDAAALSSSGKCDAGSSGGGGGVVPVERPSSAASRQPQLCPVSADSELATDV